MTPLDEFGGKTLIREYIEFKKNYFDTQKWQKEIAYHLSQHILTFVQQTQSTTNSANEEDLHNFFSLVAKVTGEWRELTGEKPYTNLVNSWRKVHKRNGSSTLAIATYYTLHTLEWGKPIAEDIDRIIFDGDTFEVANRKPVPLHKNEHLEAECKKYCVLDLGPLTVRVTDDIAEKLEKSSNEIGSLNSDGNFSILKSLRWNSGLTDIVGRNAELAKLTRWASENFKNPDYISNPQVALITGPGGSGKTRLAHEVAATLVDEGWTVYFVPRNPRKSETLHSGRTGLIIIIDYPEEQILDSESCTTFSDEILRISSIISPSSIPIRIILLSRNGADKWREKLYSSFAETLVVELLSEGSTALGLNDAFEILKTASMRVASAVDANKLNLSRAKEWLAAKQEHRLPLFATAAGIHAALSGNEEFSIGGAELMLELAHREISRVRGVSKALGLGRNDLERLLALSILTPDGLSQKTIVKLQQYGSVSSKDKHDLIELLRQTAWWRVPGYSDEGVGEGKLERIEPDRPAAAFFVVALLQDVDYRLEEWLSIVFSESGSVSVSLLSRVCFDISQLSPTLSLRLEDISINSLKYSGEIVDTFFGLSDQKLTEYSANFHASLIKQQLERTVDRHKRGVLHRTRSEALLMIGKIHAAFEESQLSIKSFFHIFDGIDPLLSTEIAKSNNQKAVCLSRMERNREALTFLQESERRLQWATSKVGDEATVELIRVRNKIIQSQQKLGNLDAAITVGRKTFELKPNKLEQATARSARTFMQFEVAKIETYLTVANVFAKKNKPEEAIKYGKEANRRLRDLEVIQPDAHKAELAASYQLLANYFSENADHEGAQRAFSSAVELYSGLNNIRPNAFSQRYANCLIDQAASCLEIDDYSNAFGCIKRALNNKNLDLKQHSALFKRGLAAYDKATSLGNIDRDENIDSMQLEFDSIYKETDQIRKNWVDLHIPATQAFVKQILLDRWCVEWCSPPIVDFDWRDLTVQESFDILTRVEILSENSGKDSFLSEYTVQKVRRAELSFSMDSQIFEIQIFEKKNANNTKIVNWIKSKDRIFSVDESKEQIDAFLRSFSSVDVFNSYDLAKFYAAFRLNLGELSFPIISHNDFENMSRLIPDNLSERSSMLRQLNGDDDTYQYLVWSLGSFGFRATQLSLYSTGLVRENVIETHGVENANSLVNELLGPRKVYFSYLEEFNDF